MSNTNLVATDDFAGAGAVVYWRISGSVDFQVLHDAWTRAGFSEDELPPQSSAETALRRAVNKQREARLLARPLDERGAWALVSEEAGSSDLHHRVELSVKVNKIGRLTFSDPNHPAVAEIEAAYRRNLNDLSASDVSAWLVRLMHKRSDAVSLREAGGFYYIPPQSVAWYQQVREVLAATSSHKLYRIPAVQVDDVVDAVLDGVIEEATKEADLLDKALTEMELGPRGLANRSERALEVMRKVERYERLLGVKASAMTARLNDLASGLAAASMAAEDEVDAKVRLVG